MRESLVDNARRCLRLANDVRIVAGMREWAIYKLGSHDIIRITPNEGRHIQSGNLNVPIVRQLVEAGVFVEKDSCVGTANETCGKSDVIPFRLAWLELTDVCNLSCSHCYINAKREDAKVETDWGTVIEYLAVHNCRQAIFIGGEPLCHPRFLKYVELAKRLAPAMNLCVVTNGTLWDDDLLGRMTELDVYMKISLLGSTAERHDGITGVPGSFDAVIKNIDLAILRGVRFEISTTLVPSSHETKESMEHFVTTRFGCVRHSITRVRPQGRQTQCGNMSDVCSEEQLAVHISKYFFDLAKRQHPCLYGKAAFSCSGLVHPCIMSRFESIDIETVLKQRPENVFHQWWTLTKDKIDGCRECALRYACFDCRGFATSMTGAPSNCRLAHELFLSDDPKEFAEVDSLYNHPVR